MKYKQFILGFLCATVIGCVAATMQIPTQVNVGPDDIEHIKGFACKVDLEYNPPGIIAAFETAGATQLNNLSAGLADEVDVYRHNFKIDYQGHVKDTIYYVKKVPE